MVTRALRLDAEFPEAIERTPNGGAVIPARLTTTGIVRYVQPDGSVVREYRSPQEVFSPESLATLHGIPVTSEHPGLVTHTNFREHARGHVVNGSIGSQPPFVDGKLAVQDGELIDDILAKRRTQLSPGYNCKLDATPGTTPEGEPYDVLQTNIRYNHIAVTKKGRQGPDVALRLDSEGNFAGESDGHSQPLATGTTTMRYVIIDGIKYLIGGTEADMMALEAAINRQNVRFDSANTEAGAQVVELRGKLLAVTARAETAEKALVAALKFDAEDAEVLTKAAAIMGGDYNPEGKSPADVMRDCVAKVYPELSLDGKSDDYIAGVFDAIDSDDIGGVAADADKPADAPATEEKPAEKMDSDPSLSRVNLGATQLPITGRQAPAITGPEALRQDAMARGRKPLGSA